MITRKTAAFGLLAALFIQGGVLAQNAPPPKLADAKPGELRMSVTAAIRIPIDAVRDQASKAAGKPLFIEYGSARGGLKDEIVAGQDFDVAILLPDVNDELVAKGKAAPRRYEIARVPVAIGLRGDVAGVDVSTPEALKATMLKAKSVKYAPTGAALMTVRKILTTLNIASTIKDSSTVRGQVPLGPGEYEINLYPLSEILPNTALKNLGPVIPQLQVPAVIECVIGKNARDKKAALALIRFLQGHAIDSALAGNGMTKSTVSHKG